MTAAGRMKQLGLFSESDMTPPQKKQFDALGKISDHPSDVIIAIDEVGMGSWAGPVTVAAVAFPKGWSHPDVGDSKKMSPRAREKALSDVIFVQALMHVVLSMPHDVVDVMGIEKARDALTESAGCALRLRYPEALVVQDGEEWKAVRIDGTIRNIISLPKADALVPAVGAASILAKVTRDTYMKAADKKYPGYGFATNVGYHSKAHALYLQSHGPCEIHRRSYEPVKQVLAAVGKI